ncbi:ABC transporter permease [Azospirillum halopraeferens]|uniref:ABC transporter permease n=1 Tax=Azospirillum halopraeferens TaxID=34010 RepID=UPI0004273AE1|nr:ABC transporter permease subunit [Azospirillum halopraeferens]
MSSNVHSPGAAAAAVSGRPGRALARAAGALVGGPMLWRLASVALFCLTWEVAGRIPVSYAFPTFGATAAAFAAMVADGSLPAAFAVTLLPLVIGVTLSAVLGVGIGVLMGLRRGAEWIAAPVFIVLQAAPMAALIPLVTFVYGIGLTSKVLAVCLLALPVIALNGYKAVRNVNPSLLAMARSFLASPWQRVVRIILPDASPVIFAGLRLGVSAGFIGVILAELLITPTGIGDLITYHRSIANYAEMYASIASIIVFSAVTLAVLQTVEVALFRPEKKGT